ncbi:MAG: amidohydrolase [Acidobacteria bacterium]|nr:MAG: amidohydrolase [Acidobacteriota bacterium]
MRAAPMYFHHALTRRELLRRAAAGLAPGWLPGLAGAPAVRTAARPPLIIDTHTHFYDPARPQGVPWPPKDNAILYRTVLPAHYRALPKPFPVAGTVVVEASAWVEDNQWILDLAARDRFIVGLVGHLPVGTAEFAGSLDRFAVRPLFRGIRVGGAGLDTALGEPRFVADLARLAERDLVLDVVGSPDMLPSVERLARQLPQLRIVIDHVAGVRIDGGPPPSDWLRGLAAVARHGTVHCKVSGLVEGSGRTGGAAPRDVGFYRAVLDGIWERFGQERLIYGSNWPVCEQFADLATVERIAVDYFESKGAAAAAAVLAANARRVYRSVERGRE